MNLFDLAERQASKWRRTEARGQETKVATYPLVLVSRQHGTDGAAIGQRVADQLGFDFWDHKLLHEMAKHGGLAEILLSSLDERPKNVFLEAFAANKHICPTTSEYMRELLFQFQIIGHHGNAVVLGRGAQFALESPRTFRVRLIAPPEHRAKQRAVQQGIEENEARAEIDQVDAARAKFIYEQWSRDIDDLHAYDLLVNVEYLSMETAADAIVTAYQGRFNLAF